MVTRFYLLPFFQKEIRMTGIIVIAFVLTVIAALYAVGLAIQTLHYDESGKLTKEGWRSLAHLLIGVVAFVILIAFLAHSGTENSHKLVTPSISTTQNSDNS